jgi:hypothetical protein
MSGKPSLKISCGFCAGFLLAALAVSLSPQSAAAASHKHVAAIAHRAHHVYPAYQFAHPRTLPGGPEYGFLTHVPPNAIRMPGYIFVPGVGILGESCDLPTSACPNEYRDHI